LEFPQYQSYSAGNVRQKGKPEDGIVKKRVSDTDGIDKVFGVRSRSASEAVSKMEAVGLIVRQENEDDRRTVNIELTETGRKKAVLATEERRRGYKELLSLFSCRWKRWQIFFSPHLCT